MIDWEALNMAAKNTMHQKKMGGNIHIKKIPTGKVMKRLGVWPNPKLPRECGHAAEYLT